MIHYTLTGPQHILEIHDDKICLHKRVWAKFFSFSNQKETWSLDDLSRFQVTEGDHFLFAKIEWESFDGHKGVFHFSSQTELVRKIEKYFQKKILKNYQKFNIEDNLSTIDNAEETPRDHYRENGLTA